nr:helix-turn-helix domain-containing protein [Streptomyces sp. SID5468]
MYGVEDAHGRGRRAAGLGCSQEMIDAILHWSAGTYERLENNRFHSAPPEQLLRQVAQLLGFDDDEWRLLWYVTQRTGAPSRAEPPSDPPPLYPQREAARRAIDRWQRAVDQVRASAYVTDWRWNVLVFNQEWARSFPRCVVPRNILRWMLLAAEAREVLGDWESCWLPAIVPQLLVARAKHPDDPVLASIEYDVLADPLLAAALHEFGPVYAHPSGAVRPVNHPEDGPGWVEMCPSSLSSPEAQLMIVIYSTEHPLSPSRSTQTPEGDSTPH